MSISCKDIKHSWGEWDSQWIEEYWHWTPDGAQVVLFSQPIPPDSPTKSPVAEVMAEKGLCVNSEPMATIVPTPDPVVSPQQAPDEGEVGLGSAFFFLVVVIAGVRAVMHLRERERQNQETYSPQIKGADVWHNLPPARDQLPRDQWVDNAIGQRAITLMEERERAEAETQGWVRADAPEAHEIQGVSRKKQPETDTETRLKQLETTLETLAKLSETMIQRFQTSEMPETPEFLGVSRSVSPETPKFRIENGATSALVEAYARLVNKQGYSPRGAPIIEVLFGVKPGGGPTYKKACELRDQLAQRLEEFS
ncbi:MAG: hypothetical protein AAFV46_09670 [Cyanobacteria bacterium J06635_11]